MKEIIVFFTQTHKQNLMQYKKFTLSSAALSLH